MATDRNGIWEPRLLPALKEHEAFLIWQGWRVDMGKSCGKGLKNRCLPVSMDGECLDCYGCAGGRPGILAEFLLLE